MASYGEKSGEKVEGAMKKRKAGTLKSGSGAKVKSRKQAIAIGLSEARKEGGKVPARKSAAKKPPARKSAAKTATAKKTTAKKSAAKKTASRKSAARKTAAKKAPAKKAAR